VSGDIAIVGMSCVFPGARDLRAYWENVIHKVDAVGDPPPEWEPDLFLDAQAESNDRLYCARGGYLGELAEFDPAAYGIMPSAVDGTEPDHFLALRAAYDAIADAGFAPTSTAATPPSSSTASSWTPCCGSSSSSIRSTRRTSGPRSSAT
jgi:acyl transferase domain-containing protein